MLLLLYVVRKWIATSYIVPIVDIYACILLDVIDTFSAILQSCSIIFVLMFVVVRM